MFIDDNGCVDPALLSDVRAIINCAGTIEGTEEEIARGNISYPVTLAATAKRHGVQKFVQVSSFSVFGRAELIDQSTPIQADSLYGRSKAEAERKLTDLMDESFGVSLLRVPFIFSAEHPGVLGNLISIMTRMRVLPTPAKASSRRSVITYGMASDILVELAEARNTPQSPLCAADAHPLDLAALAQLLRDKLQRRIATVPIPEAAIRAIELLAPRLGNRLFRSSVLEPSINIAIGRNRHSALEETARYLEALSRSAIAR